MTIPKGLGRKSALPVKEFIEAPAIRRPSRDNKMTIITIRLSGRMLQRIDALVDDAETTRAEWIRLKLRAIVENEEKDG